jgi:twinkle protein
MSKSDVLQYVDSKQWSSKEIRGGLELACPFDDCSDHVTAGHHFYLYFNNSVYKCMRCGKSGHLLKLKKLMGDLDFIKQEGGGGKILSTTLAEEKHQALMADKEALNYLRNSRGLALETIKTFRLGLDIRTGRMNESAKCIVFPYLVQGKLANLKYKSILKYPGADGGKPRYITSQEAGCQHHVYGIDTVKKDSKIITVVEGEYDALAAHTYRLPNVVSVPNGANGFGSWVEELNKYDKIYLAFDNDKAGEDGASELARRLGNSRCWRVRLPLKDLNECLCAGLTGAELQKYFTDAECYSADAAVSLEHVIDKVDSLYASAEQAKGRSTGYTRLDKMLGGYRDAEVTVITGETGTGKTTFCLNALYQCIKKGEGVLICSTEVLVEKVMAKLFSIHMEENFYDRTTFTQEMYTACREWFLTRSIFFIDVYGELPLWKVQDGIEYVARFHNVKMVLLDHLHYFLKDGEKEYTELSHFTKGTEHIAKKTLTHIFLIVHPKQMDDPEEMRGNGMSYLRGGACIKQNADNVAILWRDTELEKDGIFRVELIFKKVRDDNGKCGIIEFYFNPRTQKYSEERPPEQVLPNKAAKPAKKLGKPEVKS